MRTAVNRMLPIVYDDDNADNMYVVIGLAHLNLLIVPIMSTIVDQILTFLFTTSEFTYCCSTLYISCVIFD